MDDKRVLQAQMFAKSPGLAFVLTLIFGGLGMMYVTVLGGLFALVVDVVFYVVGFLTLGIGYIFLVIWRIICLVYVVAAVNKHNRRLLGQIQS